MARRAPDPPQKDPQTAQNVQKIRVASYLDQLNDEINDILAADISHCEEIDKLEAELKVYKQAYAGIDSEKRQLDKDKQDIQRERDNLVNQLKGFRIITLLDGDGAIFAAEYISQGQPGGHAAAQVLSDSITQYLTAEYGVNPYQLWVYIFFNKRGLGEALGRSGHLTSKLKLDDFVVGFNQAAERFLMVDVGNAKEAADAKIKAHLEDDIRLPQTFKVIFGGCHDNGYVTNLRSQITAGFQHKIVLLRSYTEMAAGLAELEFPVLTIPNLFFGQKLEPLSQAPSGQPTGTTPNGSTPSVGSTHPAFPPGLPVPYHSVTSSYSSVVRLTPKSSSTPTSEATSYVVSEDNDEYPTNVRASPTLSRPRRVNPNIPLSKNVPPPCTLHYLAHCRHGASCRFGHDYQLTGDQLSELQANAKNAPCPSINKGEVCNWGDGCCYGHFCPMLDKCYYNKQGRCKFVGVDMHQWRDGAGKSE